MCDGDLEEAQEFKTQLGGSVLVLKVLKGGSLSLVKCHGTDAASSCHIEPLVELLTAALCWEKLIFASKKNFGLFW